MSQKKTMKKRGEKEKGEHKMKEKGEKKMGRKEKKIVKWRKWLKNVEFNENGNNQKIIKKH